MGAGWRRLEGPDRATAPGGGSIEVFPTGITVARLAHERSGRPEGRPLPDRSELPDELRALLSTQPPEPGDRSHHDFHARPGHRPGRAPPATSMRAGGDTDIVHPLLVDPALACEIALSGVVFVEPIPHLRMRDSRDGDDRFLVWPVAVADDGERPVPATLHLLGSPSMVVTVLELIPARRLRWGFERFVHHGVEAMDVLARRIQLAAA